MAILINLSNGPSTSEIEKKQAEICEAEVNCNKLVIYTGLIYLLFRLPELVNAAVPLYTVSQDQDSFYQFLCIRASLCIYLNNIIQYMYIISYSVNTFFYFKFNKPFRQSVKRILRFSTK